MSAPASRVTWALSLSLFLAVLMVWGCDREPPSARAPADTAETADRRRVIVAMGDSLTEGLGVEEAQAYPARLERKLAAAGYAYRVVNAGISGETSSGALSRVDWVLTLDPDIVILETGANDGLRGVDPALTERNIDAIVRRLEEKGVTVVLAGMKMAGNLGSGFTRAFADIYPAVAERHGLILMPFFLEGVAGVPGRNLPDGIHPTGKGYAAVVERLFPFVVEAIARSGGAGG